MKFYLLICLLFALGAQLTSATLDDTDTGDQLEAESCPDGQGEDNVEEEEDITTLSVSDQRKKCISRCNKLIMGLTKELQICLGIIILVKPRPCYKKLTAQARGCNCRVAAKHLERAVRACDDSVKIITNCKKLKIKELMF